MTISSVTAPLLLIVTSVALVGCSPTEPSETQIFEAMVAAGLANQSDAGTVAKLGCKKDGDKAFRCDIGSKDGKGMAMPIRLIETDAGWRLAPGG